MNSTSSFFKRARALAQLGVLALAGLSLPVACGNDTPLDEGGNTAGKGNSNTGGAGKPGKAGSTGSTEDAGAAGAGEAGEGGAPGAGGMLPGSGGSAGKGGSAGASGSGTGGAQGGSGGATAVCGNSKLEAGEECDDGNSKDWDGCTSTCKSKCEQCEKKYCASNPATENFFLNCFTDQGSVSNPASGLSLAQAGPAQGQPKQKLCAKLVECMRRTNCAQDSPGATSPVRGCFCGSASTPDCKDPLKGPKGPCADEVGAAAESMALLDVSSRWNLGNYALGMASNIVQNCDTDVCPAECLKDKDISACERCTFGANEFKQSAGTGGDYFHCYFQPNLTCASSAGQPTSECAATTCAPAADCALSTHCAANSVTDCYGTTGQGPCAAQFAAATGSTDPATVLDRLTNGGDYPSAYLVSLLEGERQDSCKSACFPGSGGASGGSGGTSGGTSAGTGG